MRAELYSNSHYASDRASVKPGVVNRDVTHKPWLDGVHHRVCGVFQEAKATTPMRGREREHSLLSIARAATPTATNPRRLASCSSLRCSLLRPRPCASLRFALPTLRASLPIRWPPLLCLVHRAAPALRPSCRHWSVVRRSRASCVTKASSRRRAPLLASPLNRLSAPISSRSRRAASPTRRMWMPSLQMVMSPASSWRSVVRRVMWGRPCLRMAPRISSTRCWPMACHAFRSSRRLALVTRWTRRRGPSGCS